MSLGPVGKEGGRRQDEGEVYARAWGDWQYFELYPKLRRMPQGVYAIAMIQFIL